MTPAVPTTELAETANKENTLESVNILLDLVRNQNHCWRLERRKHEPLGE